MKLTTRIMGLVLSICMLLSMIPATTVLAAGSEPNVTLTVDKTTVKKGDEITVELANSEMTFQGLSLKLFYDSTLVECTAMLNVDGDDGDDDLFMYYLNSKGKEKKMTPTVADCIEDMDDGQFSFAMMPGEDTKFLEGTVVTFTFVALEAGEVTFKLEEICVGVSEYEGEISRKVTIKGSEPEVTDPTEPESSEPEADCSEENPHAMSLPFSETVTDEDYDHFYKWTATADGTVEIAFTDDAAWVVSTSDGQFNSGDYNEKFSFAVNEGAEYIFNLYALAGEELSWNITFNATPTCEHKDTELVSKNNGTHNVVCDCGQVVDENVTCTGEDDGNCTTAVVCACGYTITAAKTHVDGNDDGHVCDNDGCNVTVENSCTPGEPVVTTTPSTCTEEGSVTTETFCTQCGKKLSSKTTSLGYADHSWGDTTYDWSADGKTCTAAHACEAEDCEVSEEEVATIANGKVTGEVTTPATCNEKGTTTYTANFDATWAADGQTTTREDVPATGAHSGIYYFNWSVDIEKNEIDCNLVIYCRMCKKVVHSAYRYDDGEVKTVATCKTPGIRSYTFDFSDVKLPEGMKWENFELSNTNQEGAVWNAETKVMTCDLNMGLDNTNHESEKFIYVNNEDDTHTKKHACCDAVVGTLSHTWGDGVVNHDSPCLGEGTKTYTCTAEGCGATYTEPVAANGHTFGTVVPAVEANCQTGGNVAYKQCTVCNLYFAADAATDAANGEETNAAFQTPVNAENHASDAITYVKTEGSTHTVKHTCCGVEEEPAPHDYSNADHKCVCGKVEMIAIIVQYPAKAPNAFKQEFITAPYGTTVNLTPAPEAIGHTFTGFRDLSTYEMVATAEDNYAYSIEHEVILEAAYEANNYNITWNLNGGKLVEDGIVLPATVKYDLPIKVLTSNDLTDGKFVERDGHTFSHFEDQDGNRYDVNKDGMTNEGTTWKLGNMPAGDLELTAVWTVNKYNLRVYDSNGAILLNEQVSYGENVYDLVKDLKCSPIPVATATQIGHDVFVGWIDIYGNPIVSSYTMPASDLHIVGDMDFTGWIKYSYIDGWVYEVESQIQKTGWTQIDGEWYYLDPETGVRAEGVKRVPYPTEAINGKTYAPNASDKASWEANKENSKYTDAETAIFVFGDDGKFQQITGLIDGGKRYAFNGMVGWHPGMVQIDGEYYYFGGDKLGGGNIAANGDVKVTRLNGIKGFENNAIYNFANGKLSGLHGISDGKYYQNSKLMRGAGLVKIEDGKYIFVRSLGQLATGDYWVTEKSSNGLCDPGMYTFDENGFMVIKQDLSVEGIVDGVYYKNGKPYYAGLIEIDGHMYYIRSNGQVATGEYYVTKVNGTGIAKGTKLVFGADGKMEPIKNGIVEENGKNFYYENGKIMKGKGVVKLTDENGKTFYIYVKSNGQLATGIYWPSTRNDLLPRGGYNWGTDGRYYPKG